MKNVRSEKGVIVVSTINGEEIFEKKNFQNFPYKRVAIWNPSVVNIYLMPSCKCVD